MIRALAAGAAVVALVVVVASSWSASASNLAVDPPQAQVFELGAGLRLWVDGVPVGSLPIPPPEAPATADPTGETTEGGEPVEGTAPTGGADEAPPGGEVPDAPGVVG